MTVAADSYLITYDYGTEMDFEEEYYESFPSEEAAISMFKTMLIHCSPEERKKYFNVKIAKVVKKVDIEELLR